MQNIIDKNDPTLVYVHVPFGDDELNDNAGTCQLMANIDKLATQDRCVVVADTLNTSRWHERGYEPIRCRGDLAFYCSDKDVADQLANWADKKDNGNPRCVEDLEETEFADVIREIAEELHLDKSMHQAFVGTEESAAEPISIPIDSVEDDVEIEIDSTNITDKEADLLDAMPLPGYPKSGQERRTKWLALPRRARIAIRRLHRNFRHLPKSALVQMLRAAKAPKEYIVAAKSF